MCLVFIRGAVTSAATPIVYHWCSGSTALKQGLIRFQNDAVVFYQ